MSRSSTTIIDAHAAIGQEHPHVLTIADLLRRMDASDVAMALIRPMGAALVVDHRVGNDRLLHAGPRFRALVSVNPWFGAAALEELRRCRDAGAVGLYLHPSRQGFMPLEPVLEPLIGFAAEHGWPVMFHTGTYIQSDVLALATLAQDHPQVPFIFAGAGFTDMWFELPGAIAQSPNLHFDTSMIWSAAIMAVVQTLGAQHVLFSGGEPRNHYPVVLRALDRAELTDSQRRAILHDNAARLFQLEGDQSPQDMRIIDFHTHLADRWFETPLIGEADFVAGLDRCGVQMACVFTLMGFYEDAARHNDHLASRARANPGRMIPFATVDPKRGMAAVRELDRCLCDPLFRGVKFHPWLQAFAPSMVKPVMLDILKLAADRGVPVLFHDGTPPYSTTFQIAEVARWNEHVNVVLGHAGLADYTLAAGVLGARIDNLYLCACCPHAGDIAYLVNAVGADKVLFGSDFGIADWRMLAERLDDVLFAGLDDAALDKVLYANAARLLRLAE